jgi:hypothetical protein
MGETGRVLLMKYTMSKDGIERVTVRVSLRFTRDEVEFIKELAKKEGQGWRDWIEGRAALGVEGDMVCEDGSYDQRVGRSGSSR